MTEQAAADAPPSKLGIATTSYLTVWRPQDTLEFLEHCHALGAAGIQSAIHGDPAKLRARAEQLGMYVEAMVPLPHGDDTSAFEESMKTAQAAGAIAVRSACLGTRRYETFKSLDQWHDFVTSSNRSVAAALPVLDRYKIPLGLENHKDWTADEMHAFLEKHSSEYLGVCLDFGNNISLLDDPMYVIEKLAPYAVSTHLKNMAADSYDNGFLLSEVLLGDGFLDLPRIISIVKQARPKTRFSLEMITRDPLRVPCLTDNYWVSFPDRNGIYLARTLKLVQRQRSPKPLPQISQHTHDEQLKVENENVIACMRYAHEHLEL
ncbi:MAG TPA: TIM barrel protein [Bryobacteraceae bacterium]|nr:TIM barrel protein [Bryobacteraceae bacterium]